MAVIGQSFSLSLLRMRGRGNCHQECVSLEWFLSPDVGDGEGKLTWAREVQSSSTLAAVLRREMAARVDTSTGTVPLRQRQPSLAPCQPPAAIPPAGSWGWVASGQSSLRPRQVNVQLHDDRRLHSLLPA